MKVISFYKIITIVLVVSFVPQVHATSVNRQVSLTDNLSFTISWFADLRNWWKEFRKSIRIGKETKPADNNKPQKPVSVREPQTWMLILATLIGLGGFMIYRKKSKK